MAEEDGGALVAHFVGGGGGVAAEFVGVGGEGVAEDVLRPGDAGGAGGGGEEALEAVLGESVGWACLGERVGGEPGAEVCADGDGARGGCFGVGLGEEDVFGADVCGAAADAAVCSAREMQERLSRQFRALDEAGEVEAMVKVGALLAKLTGAEAATRVEVRNGGVTADYAPPPAVARMDDEALLALATARD